MIDRLRPEITREPRDRTGSGRRWYAGSLVYSGAGLVWLFVWLLWGDFGYELKERSVPPTMQLLLAQNGVSNFVVGLLLTSLPHMIAIVAVPVVGYASDRYRSKLGRRIPFLLASIPVTFVAMMGLAFSSSAGGFLHKVLGSASPGENSCVFGVIVLGWALFEFCMVTSNSVYLSLIADVVPAPVLGRFFGLFRVASLLAGLIFNYEILSKVEHRVSAVFVGVGMIYIASFALMCAMVKEGNYPEALEPLPSSASKVTERFAVGFRAWWHDCFSQSYYRWIFVSYLFTYLAIVPVSLFSLFFARSLGIDLATYGKYAALQLALSLLVAYPAGLAADKFHPLRMTITAQGLMVLGFTAAFFWVRSATGFGISFVAGGCLLGFWSTSSAALPAVLLPKTYFATLSSAIQISVALGTMIAGPLCGSLLDLTHRDYRYIYLWAGLLSILTLCVLVKVYTSFRGFGGTSGYSAPQIGDRPL